MKTSFILSIAALLSPAAAFSTSRRGALEKVASASAAAAATLLVGPPANAAQEAEYNQLVELLKARSDENKEANANYAMRANKMSERDFKDAKNRRPKLM